MPHAFTQFVVFWSNCIGFCTFVFAYLLTKLMEMYNAIQLLDAKAVQAVIYYVRVLKMLFDNKLRL